jgi:hypothetical protein
MEAIDIWPAYHPLPKWQVSRAQGLPYPGVLTNGNSRALGAILESVRVRVLAGWYSIGLVTMDRRSRGASPRWEGVRPR